MNKNKEIDIPEWFKPRLRQTLGHLRWVLGDNEQQSVTVGDNLTQEMHVIVDYAAALYHSTIKEQPDEDKLFYALVLNTITENGIDISCPKKVDVVQTFKAYQQQKEDFFKFCEEETSSARRTYWADLKKRL